MKVAILAAVAMSGLALAAPLETHAEAYQKDNRNLHYANSVPVKIAAEGVNHAIAKRASAYSKDNRKLHYVNHVPIAQAE